METHEVKSPVRDTVLRAIAVLGLIAVLLLGAWGIIQLAVSIPSLFSNIGSGSFSFFNAAPKTETLTVDSVANLTSGQTLQVSWNHQNKNDGAYSYSISHACKDGLSVKAPLPTGSYQTVACNTPFNFVNASNKMTLLPTVTKSATPLVLTVSATNLATGAITSQGSATTNVAPTTKAVVTPTKPVVTTPSNSGTTYVPATTRAALYGYGDLAIRINSITPSANGLTSVVFTVENLGTNIVASGWNFNANLPVNGSYLYTSPAQRALNPGDKIVFTLTFSNNYTGGTYPYDNGWGYSGNGYYTGTGSYNCNGYTVCYQNQQPTNYGYNYQYTTYNNYGGPITITVDPQNFVWESNENNNTVYSN